jgi:flagellar assembly factor FliW
MQLETTRFGTIEIDPATIITFTQPIIGFQEYRRFVLLPGPGGEQSPPTDVVKWLQSTDSGELAFLLMRPHVVVPDYTVEVTEHDLTELAATSIKDLEVYTLLVAPQDHTQIRTNLRAPVLVSPKHRLGKQIVLEHSDYPIQFFLAQAQRGSQKPQEVSHARADA